MYLFRGLMGAAATANPAETERQTDRPQWKICENGQMFIFLRKNSAPLSFLRRGFIGLAAMGLRYGAMAMARQLALLEWKGRRKAKERRRRGGREEEEVFCIRNWGLGMRRPI